MSFITNITNDVPDSGLYGADNDPAGINNNGGTETTPQDAGNVPSAGTESREGVNNDKSISANVYNQPASSTDAQAIGLGSSSLGPKQENKYNPDAQRFFNSQFRNDLAANNAYPRDSFDHYKEESPAGSIQPIYRSTFNVQAGSINQSGDIVGASYVDNDLNPINNPVTITTSVGGAVFTAIPSKPDANFPQVTNPFTICSLESEPLIDTSGCSWGYCADALPFADARIGKKMRIFQGQGCKESGYWVQYLDRSYDNTDAEAHANAINCEFLQNSERRTFGQIDSASSRVSGRIPDCGDKSSGRSYCRKNIAASGAIPPATFNRGKTYGHRLMYVGTSLAGIKEKEWCAYAEDKRVVYPPNPLTVTPSGHDEWFFEGARCNADGTRNTSHSGKLYGCCCKAGGFGGDAEGYSVTYVGDLTLGTADDPCDCRRRKENGAKFLTEWNAAFNLEDKWVNVLMTGCTEGTALDGYIHEGVDVDLYCLATGRPVNPVWSETECAWYHDLQRVSRCSGTDPRAQADPDNAIKAIKIHRYCPSGSVITNITDRNLFPIPVGTWSDPHGRSILEEREMINYAWCATGSCNTGDAPCTMSDSLFEVGDYVNLTSHQLTGYMNANGSFSGAFEIDLTLSGVSGNTLGGPFPTGCAADSASFCVYTFDGTGSPGAGPGGYTYGNWVVSDSGTCCACESTLPTSGLQPDGSFAWTPTETLSIDCIEATTGCDVLTQGWQIHAKASGDRFSTPNSLDCTWGYSVKFTGCPGGTGICAATGFAPRYIDEYIPESYFTSGTGCS